MSGSFCKQHVLVCASGSQVDDGQRARSSSVGSTSSVDKDSTAT